MSRKLVIDLLMLIVLHQLYVTPQLYHIYVKCDGEMLMHRGGCMGSQQEIQQISSCSFADF